MIQIQNFITDWETNERLTLSQRENYKWLEEIYLRQKYSRKENILNYNIIDNKSYCMLIENNLYTFIDELDDQESLFHKNGQLLKVKTDSIEKKEGSRLWKLL